MSKMIATRSGRMNVGRVLGGGLVAGLVLNVGEVALEPLIGAEFAAWLEGMGAAPLGEGAMAGLMVLGFLLGIVTVWLYAAIRPRFGPGPRTALIAALAVWLLACFGPSVGMGLYGILPTRLLVAWILWPLVQVPAAALAGAWVYRETPAADPAGERAVGTVAV